MKQIRIYIILMPAAVLLSGCATRLQSASTPLITEPTGLQMQSVGTTQSTPYWVFSFGWRCNAEGGYYQSYCYDYKEVPDPSSGVFQVGQIHCKTEQETLKRDPNTLAGWRIGRGSNGVLTFRHVIRANSPVFGPGREIAVAYRHFVIKSEDKETIGNILGCDFTWKGGDEFP
jgi:hypothetical protein